MVHESSSSRPYSKRGGSSSDDDRGSRRSGNGYDTKKRSRNEDGDDYSSKKNAYADGNKYEAYVGNLPLGKDEQDLRELLEKSCGTIMSIKFTSSGGAAFVAFQSESGLDGCLRFNETEFDGRTLRINRAGDKPQASGRSATVSGDTVMLRNLSYRAQEDQIRDALARCGDILSVRIPTDRESQRPRGFAFVQFESEASAKAAVDLGAVEVDGRESSIQMSEPRDGSSRGGGGGRGGSSRGGGGGGGYRGGGGRDRDSGFRSRDRY